MFTYEIISFLTSKNYNISKSELAYVVQNSPQIETVTFDTSVWKYRMKVENSNVYFNVYE